MNSYFVYTTMIDPKGAIPYVQEHLVKVEKTNRSFSWGDNPGVIVHHYYKLVEVLTGGEIPGKKLKEFSIPPEIVMEFPDDQAALLWYALKSD